MEFGSLESVDLRQAWRHEARDFTPWLADNLDALGEATGLNLKLEGIEAYAGGYPVDILARDESDGGLTIIENQLEDSDYGHLTQILIYLAEHDAAKAIWVARSFNKAHLNVIRWLNNHTPIENAFFAVRVSVVRIGKSPMAPVFEVVERPITRREGMSELGQFRREFWNYYAERYPDDGVPANYAVSSVWHGTGDPDMVLVQYLMQDYVGMAMRGKQGMDADSITEKFERYASVIRSRFNIELEGRSSWGSLLISNLRIDARQRDNWPRMTDWLHEEMHRYSTIFTN